MRKSTTANLFTKLMIASIFCSSAAKLYEVHAENTTNYVSRQPRFTSAHSLYYVGDVLANGWVFHQQPVDGYYYLFYKNGERLTGMGTDGNGDHLFINGLLAQGLQEYNGEQLYYKEGNRYTGFADNLYYVNGYIANGWVFHQQSIEGKYYLFYGNGIRLTGYGVDGNGEHLFINGLLAEGLQSFEGEERYYEQGNAITGFRNNKYYIQGYIANGWTFHEQPIDGHYYLFYKDGAILTGMGIDGNGEHLFVNGLLAQGYVTYNGVTHFYKDGNAIGNPVNKYYINGAIANGWAFHQPPVDGYYYLFYKDGERLTGLGTDANGEHLFVNGLLAEGIQEYNGVYSFYKEGNKYTGIYDNKYYVSGVIANGWVFHQSAVDGYHYLFYKDGQRLTGLGTDANGEHYFIQGSLAQGLQIVDGYQIYFKDGNRFTGVVGKNYYVDGHEANGWVFHQKPVNGNYYLFYKYGERLTGLGSDGNGQHYFINGLLAQGIQEYDGVKRLFVNGDLVNGWYFHKQPVNGKYYLFYVDGELLSGIGKDANGEHLFIDGLLAQGYHYYDGEYHLYKDGNIIETPSTKYYVNGVLANGWSFHHQPIDGYYYLFYKDGERLTGLGIDGNGEHLFINGLLAQGQQSYEGKRRLYRDGDLYTGFNDNKFYVNGELANGWSLHQQPVDGYYYQFYKDGQRLTGYGKDGNGEHLFINGQLAQGLQNYDGVQRIYKDGNVATGWVNDTYLVNGSYANGWVRVENGDEIYFENGKNSSPVTLSANYTNEEFIQVMAYYVHKYAARYGIKVNSGIIAQAILESNWGRSTLSAKYHNYFGLKTGPYWTGKSVNMATMEEYTPGTYTNIRDNFRAYDSLEAGVLGYFEFTKFPNYAAIKTATTAEQYLTYIKQAGYATSSTYVQNTLRVVYTYNLTKYD